MFHLNYHTASSITTQQTYLKQYYSKTATLFFFFFSFINIMKLISCVDFVEASKKQDATDAKGKSGWEE